MARSYQVISADGHVETPPGTWVRHVPKRWQEHAPRLVPVPGGGEAWIVEGRPILQNGQNIVGRGSVKLAGGTYFNPDGSPAEGAGPAAQRLREQDLDGIDAEVLFPPVFATTFIEGIGDRGAYTAMVAAYNTFLAEDYCSVAPDRLIGNAVIPVTGIDDAIAELEHVKALGLRSVSPHQFPNGTGFSSPEDDRFYAHALELGVLVSPHFGMGEANVPASAPGAGTASDPFASSLARRGGPKPVFCLAQLIASRVFDRFPELRFYFAETNAYWLPGALWFLDDSYALFRDWFCVTLERQPSEYVVEHCYFSIVRDPVAIRMRELQPMNRLMWGSDFPHSVTSFPRSREFLDDAFAGVDEKLRRQVLLETPAEYFGLDLDATLTETPSL